MNRKLVKDNRVSLNQQKIQKNITGFFFFFLPLPLKHLNIKGCFAHPFWSLTAPERDPRVKKPRMFA